MSRQRYSQQLMKTSIRTALDPLDLAGIDDLLSIEEKTVRSSVRQMCHDRILPYVADWFERGAITDPRGLARELGSLGVLGMHLDGYRRPRARRRRGHSRSRSSPRSHIDLPAVASTALRCCVADVDAGGGEVALDELASTAHLRHQVTAHQLTEARRRGGHAHGADRPPGCPAQGDADRRNSGLGLLRVDRVAVQPNELDLAHELAELVGSHRLAAQGRGTLTAVEAVEHLVVQRRQECLAARGMTSWQYRPLPVADSQSTWPLDGREKPNHDSDPDHQVDGLAAAIGQALHVWLGMLAELASPMPASGTDSQRRARNVRAAVVLHREAAEHEHGEQAVSGGLSDSQLRCRLLDAYRPLVADELQQAQSVVDRLQWIRRFRLDRGFLHPRSVWAATVPDKHAEVPAVPVESGRT